MNDADWLHLLDDLDLVPAPGFVRQAPTSYPPRQRRQAGDPTFRAEAVCLHKACPWVSTARQAGEHRDVSGHPVAYPS